MDYKAIIISGVEGSGKSTIARALCRKYPILELVKTVTTRHTDSRNGFELLSDLEFRGRESIISCY